MRPRSRTLVHLLLASALVLCAGLVAAAGASAAVKKVARAKVADKAKNALKVNGIKASKTPRANQLLALGPDGRFAAAALPADVLRGSLPNYTAGFGLNLSNSVFAVDAGVIQRRISDGCPAGQAMRGVNENGTVSCQVMVEPPLLLQASSSGEVLDVQNTGSGIGIQARSSSSFATGYFSNSGAGGGLRADTSSSGQGSAVTAYNYGTDRYGVETEIVNSSNPRAAIYARTAGNGQAIDAEINSNTNGDALFARTTSSSPSSFAGIFVGNVSISGNLAKSSGSFVIDHPLDPANKFLQHSFVESPDMKNIYDGVARTDDEGFATVTLPKWFGALNRDFRYQLTPIGSFSRAMVAEEIEDNRFRIRTEEPGVKVSWQVTGIREDAYANANRIEVEKDKSAAERGRYLAPEEHGQPASKAITKR